MPLWNNCYVPLIYVLKNCNRLVYIMFNIKNEDHLSKSLRSIIQCVKYNVFNNFLTENVFNANNVCVIYFMYTRYLSTLIFFLFIFWHILRKKKKTFFTYLSVFVLAFDYSRVTTMGIATMPRKQFNCRFCNYASSRKYNLQLHLYTHTGEKPFKCNLCETNFIQKSNLKTHIWKHHSK